MKKTILSLLAIAIIGGSLWYMFGWGASTQTRPDMAALTADTGGAGDGAPETSILANAAEAGGASSSGNATKAGAVQTAVSTIHTADSLLERSYSEQRAVWRDVPAPTGVVITVSPGQSTGADRDAIVPKGESRGYADDTVRLKQGAEVTLDIEMKETGLYWLAFDYYVLDDSILSPEGYIQINDQYPFYEARRILFPNLWETKSEAIKLDRYGNELLPKPDKVAEWQTTYAGDASGFHMEPLLFKLERGINKIKLANTRGDLLLGNVKVESAPQIDTYEQYAKRHSGGEAESDDTETIVIEGESTAYLNDSSIRATSVDDPGLTPYETGKRRLNVLEDVSWSKGGQSVTWQFDVPKSGSYVIAVKYMQDEKKDMPVFRRLKIDGVMPFREAGSIPFPFGSGWQNATISDGETPYRFYLEQGKHTLTLDVDLSLLRPLSEDITATMKEISKLALEVQRLTGNKKDAYRDWSLTEYIPDLDKRLTALADRLESRYDKLRGLNPAVDDIGELTNLKLAVKQLRSLASNPDELPNRLNLLSQGSSSVAQLLGDLLQRISLSPLAVDRIYVSPSGNIPAPEAGWWTKTTEGVKRFFLSFGKQQYSTATKDTAELDVWVNRPRQYVELMQKMIDERFTPETGIPVKLSIMPDENKLVLANASGDQPDVALGVNNWLSYEFAIRNAALDLRGFKDYADVIKHFSKGAVIPLVFEDGVYALPETQNFWVLFYRKDILDSMKLSPPDTWDDVVGMLPELQRLGMNFYEPLSLYRGFKPFNATTPFIYQWGGELFKDGGMTTAIDSEKALEGIKFMTDLFTIYNVPQDIPNFYHHFRYGTLPVGISDFNTYVQLRTAAPEIAGSWKIALHPGVKQGGTVERWSPAGGQAGMIFKGTDKADAAWSFLKWWTSADIQIDFANQLQTTYGETYMWNTANLDAFKQLPWPEQDKKIVLKQYEWVREASRVPGAYMVEREISNIWNKVVFNGANPRTTIDDAVIRTNREIARKMEEFGYVKDGRSVKPYPVPTISTMDKWVEPR